jgi:hypothetical protein
VSSTTIRIRPDTHKRLRGLAQRRGIPMAQLLEEVVERLRREELLEQTNAAYATLRADAQAWAEEEEERQAWDTTVADGAQEE